MSAPENSVEADRYYVEVRFQESGPPAVQGWWMDGEVALRKYRGWVGSHGSRDGAVITLQAEAGGALEPMRTWTKERGEVIHRR